VHLLGGFRVDLNGGVFDLGAKPATRVLDILRMLSVSKDQSCSLDHLQDLLWPDLDGDQAKAACEQALHRLRKMLGRKDLIVQREGRVRLASDNVWVDLQDWEARLKQALSRTISEQEALLPDFPGPALHHSPVPSWAIPATERVRDGFVELAVRVGKHREAQRDYEGARAAYLRVLDFYPDSARAYQFLIQERLQQNDVAGAIECYARYERTIEAEGQSAPSPAIRSLIRPHLKA
jgi:DNA-binding SARP family transcriptional activator